VRYIIRLNPKAWNPLTKSLIPSRLWEIEQVETKDSAKVIWHCADVRIDKTSIRELFKLPEPGGPPWSVEYFGFAVRGYDDAIEIRTGEADASGN
jgi:hypothetical protein